MIRENTLWAFICGYSEFRGEKAEELMQLLSCSRPLPVKDLTKHYNHMHAHCSSPSSQNGLNSRLLSPDLQNKSVSLK